MFAKVFTQILESSLAEDYKTRLVFEDLLKLCDIDGVVDMTHEAIARRTNVPLKIVRHAIEELEKPDPRSRTTTHEGRRIVRLDETRDWGWLIVNHGYYRNLASEEQRRLRTKARTRKWRENNDLQSGDATVTPCDADVTLSDGCDAKQKQKEEAEAEAEAEAFKKFHSLEALDFASEKAAMIAMTKILGKATSRQWGGKWRMRYRENSSKFERVMLAIVEELKRGTVENPGGYADDIWQRFAD